MIFRFNPLVARAVKDEAFRWRTERDRQLAMRDLTWDFAEPDQYPGLVAQEKPGLMASKGEKEFHAAVSNGVSSAVSNRCQVPAAAMSYRLGGQFSSHLLFIGALDRYLLEWPNPQTTSWPASRT